jgi:hypothetical protein
MAEYDAEGNEIEEQPQSLWELMEMDEPEDEPYSEEQDDADEQIAKDDKLDKKLSAKFDAREKKFETIMLKDQVGKYQAQASELEQSLFKAVASDVKTLADFDKTVKAVAIRAQKMEAAAAAYQVQMEAQAAQQVANAWGSGPLGTPQPKTQDYEADLMKKIEGGDIKALYADLVSDAPWMK